MWTCFYSTGDEEDRIIYTGVGLGYAEDPEHPIAMRRDYFPSKIGGRPVRFEIFHLFLICLSLTSYFTKYDVIFSFLRITFLLSFPPLSCIL